MIISPNYQALCRILTQTTRSYRVFLNCHKIHSCQILRSTAGISIRYKGIRPPLTAHYYQKGLPSKTTSDPGFHLLGACPSPLCQPCCFANELNGGKKTNQTKKTNLFLLFFLGCFISVSFRGFSQFG